MITMLKKTRGKKTFEQDTKLRDESAGHTTERGSKLSETPNLKMLLSYFFSQYTRNSPDVT